MLELKNICKTYATGGIKTKALDKISITFRDNEFVAVLGPSGSGKTTLLNVIGGLDHYNSGDLLINGVSTKHFSERDWDFYRNNEVGFVFQNYNLIPHQSVLSNVELALTLSGSTPHERKELAKKALESVGLGEHINKKPNQLSGGQMQRVAIARALVNNPSIIFADEPTGALDTKTSVSVMEILKEVAKDKLVVMVTHNPDLANDYATRIVNLKDAKITADSHPYSVKEEKVQAKLFGKNKKKHRTSMSFFTALSLSFANLMGKKGRTFMTAFAGSIGIIGIAAILSLSTGTRQYIDHVEHNTLSQYPLSISRSKSIMSSLNESSKGGSVGNIVDKMTYNQQDENKIGIRSTYATILNASGANDLRSFKSYLSTNPEDFNNKASSVEYTYGTSAMFYANDKYGQRQVYPQTSLSTSMGGSSISSANNSSSGSQGISGPMAEMSSTSSFFTLPSKDELYKNQYSVAAGRWPEAYNECVVVLHQDGTINDSLLYTLGIRDHKELEEAVKRYSKNEKADIPSKFEDLNYDDILGHKFKIINPADCYTYNDDAKVWIDNSLDEEYMKTKLSASEDLTIVGIIQPPEGVNNSLILTSGINFPFSLTKQSINKSAESQIVKEQLASPDKDVLTGKTFEEEKESSIGADFFASFVKINPDAMSNLISVDKNVFSAIKNNPQIDISQDDINKIIAESISEESIAKIVADIALDKGLDADMQKIIADACQSYVDYIKVPGQETETVSHYFSPEGEGYSFIKVACATAGLDATPAIVEGLTGICTNLVTQLVRTMTTALSTSFNSVMQSISGLDKAISFNKDALTDVFQFDLSEDKLMQISKLVRGTGIRTLDSNLADFGYADLDNPLSVTIYPNDFNAKEQISQMIEDYNTSSEEDGHPEKVISYSDFAKLLMTSLTTMIDMITAVLIAFVAISLVVSSIMIGIITYISVLERQKEIGILRAIGASKRDIFNVFNAETFIVGIVAGLLGIIITSLGCIPANIIAKHMFNIQYDIAILPVWSIFALIFISVLLTFIAGLIPSSSAAKKDPVEAINS